MTTANKAYLWYCFRLFLIRFVIIGLMSYVVEVVYTSLSCFYHTVESQGWSYVFAHTSESFQAKTGIGAFFIYCWAAIPFTFLSEPMKKISNWRLPKVDFDFGIFVRAIVYGLIFMAIEFLTGFVAKYLFNGYPGWDYTKLPLNILGLTSFVLLPIWAFAGGIGEFFHNRLTQLDDAIANPKDFDYDNIVRGYIKKRYGEDI